jgi:tetratricopeptide (TPR) repeat protein
VISSVAAGNFERGDKEASRKLFERAWKQAQKVDGPYKEVFFLSLADDASRAGDKETAKQFYGRFRDYLQMLGGEAEFLGMRKLGEAQLEAKMPEAALKTFQSAAEIAMEGNAPEDAGEIAGLMAAAGFSKEADALIEKFMLALAKLEPEEERPGLAALLADTLNREGVFPRKVLELLKQVSADDRIYLLPEAAMNLASSGEMVAAAGLLPQVREAEDQVPVMCAISDAWWKAKDEVKAKDWAARALATAKTIKEDEVQRESLLEVAEQLVSVGLAAEARVTWQGVAAAGEEFRRAIAEREFFQMVEDHEWKRAEAALKSMADSPDVGVLQSGLAAELAKEGELDAALKIVDQLPPTLPARLEILRLAYEKHGSSVSPGALMELLAKHTDPEVIVSLIVGHVGGFRRLPAEH